MANQFVRTGTVVAVGLIIMFTLSVDEAFLRSLEVRKATTTTTATSFAVQPSVNDGNVLKQPVANNASTEASHSRHAARSSHVSSSSSNNNNSTSDRASSSSPSPPPSMSPAMQTSEPGKVLCIAGGPYPFYGRTFNRIMQTANALEIARERGGAAVGLSERWSEWYLGFLDPRPDILLNYTGQCAWSLTPEEVFRYYKFNPWRSMKYLQQLIPKAEYRNQAEAALSAWKGPVTTVHRRNLEGYCAKWAANFTMISCPNWKTSRKEMNVQNLLDICNLDYKMIANETQGASVLLLTDLQVPELDRTFENISNHSFAVETWMMVMSDVHYGVPFSTVDLVVYYWRMFHGKKDSMRPRSCYREST